MKKILITIILLAGSLVFAQQNNQQAGIDLFQPGNIKIFADYLYCSKDYLRAADEYERCLKAVPDDTIEFKIALSYSLMNNYTEAEKRFVTVKQSSVFYQPSQMLYLKSIFQSGDIPGFMSKFDLMKNTISKTDGFGLIMLYNYSFLLTEGSLPEETVFIKSFAPADSNKIKYFYAWKKGPPYKSPLKAAILSAIIPGAGKIYTEEYSDGILAFIATAGCAYLAYDNFNAGHNIRGWIFSGLAAGFYAGNIYGSAASVQIYNARIKFDFVNEVKSFIENKNYFLRVFNFCK